MLSTRKAAALAALSAVLVTAPACGGHPETAASTQRPPSDGATGSADTSSATGTRLPDPTPSESSANSRSKVGPNGVGPIRLGRSVAALKALGARFSEGGAVGEGRCQVFAVSWAGGTVHGQVEDQAGVEIIYLDRWGETPEGIGAGDDADEVAAAYQEYRPDSPRLEVRAGRDAMWAFRFDGSGRPITVGSVALMQTDQNCTIL